MNEERIQEAQENIQSYLDQGLIRKSNFDEELFNMYMKDYKESLKVAIKLQQENLSTMWTIVSSYYSMFYISNACLLKLGYKVGHQIAHKVTSDALIIYAKDKVKEDFIEEFQIASEDALSLSKNLLDLYDMERIKRSRIQYDTPEHIKQAKAITSITRAKEFGIEMERLISEL